MMYRRILVPLDGTDGARRALQPAAALASAFSASIVLLRVVEPESLAATTADDRPEPGLALSRELREAEVAAAEAELAGRRPELLSNGVDRVETVVAAGPVGDAIIEQATARDCDLIVMASHRRGGLARALLGSVTDHAIRHSRGVAILVVPFSES